MIILTIRTDKPESEIGIYNDTVKQAYEKWEAHRQLAETLHLRIRQLLEKNGFDWKSLEGIVVFEGPGSFTGLRIGVSVANALSYGLHTPIIGAQGKAWIRHGINAIRAGKGGLSVLPFYGSDANITTPRR